jgi:hypothetical protein
MQAINAKIEDVERQRLNKRVRFGALFVRRSRIRKGPKWIVVMTPEMWCRMYEYAMMGVDLERQEKSTKMSHRDRGRGSK